MSGRVRVIGKDDDARGGRSSIVSKDSSVNDEWSAGLGHGRNTGGGREHSRPVELRALESPEELDILRRECQ